jgi:tetratricopeptide (TPR) repeat protein
VSCLDDDTVLRMIEGELAPPALAAADAHLDGCAACRDLLAVVARAQAPAAAGVLARGQVIGRYVVGELLGAGAMGRVYSAWEPELDRRVALKVLRDDAAAAGDGARQRVVREAQAMAKLAHPNVVTVHEVGTVDDAVYVAMELVEGDTLRAWGDAHRTRRDVRGSAALLVEIARGLAAVHAAGVVHRDIKPDNIIVGADGRARLGDFGLARARGAEVTAPAEDRARVAASAANPATAKPEPPHDDAGRALSVPRPAPTVFAAGTPSTTGSIAGTPAYMAPEVLRGGAADAVADQFSFGVTAWELLHGQRPFAGTTWGELLVATERGTVRAPVARVPGWLDAVVRRCLAADPARRFPTMRAVADALVAGLARRRAPAAWLAAGVVPIGALALYLALRGDGAAADPCAGVRAEVAGLALPAGVEPHAASAVARWRTRWGDVRAATCRAAAGDAAVATRRCLDQRKAEVAALLDRLRTGPATARTGLVDALATLPAVDECAAVTVGGGDPRPIDPALAARVQAVEAALPGLRAAIALGDAGSVVAGAREAAEQAQASGHQPTLAAALIVRAEVERGAGRLDAAAETARDAAVAAERGHADALAAEAWLERVIVAGDRRELAVAEDFAHLADAAIARAGGRDRLATRLLELRGKLAYNRGRLAEARALLAEALRREEGHADGVSVELARLHSAIGQVDRAAGRLDDAEHHLRRALDVDRALRGARHPQIALDLHNVAGVLRLRPDLDGALALYREALAIDEAAGGAESSAAGLTHNSIGLVHMARADWAAARGELERAHAILSAAGHADRAMADHNLGLVAQATGDHKAAVARFVAAAAVYAQTIGVAAPPAVRLVDDLAVSERALARRGKLTAATEPPPAAVPVTMPELVLPPPTAPPQPAPPALDAQQGRKDVGVYGSAQTF